MKCRDPNWSNIHSRVFSALNPSSSAAIASWSRSVIVGTLPERVMGGGFMVSSREGLNRALSLAALDFVWGRALPVDELLHGL